MLIPTWSGRFPGRGYYKSIKPGNPVNQSVFIKRLLTVGYPHAALAGREAAARRRLRRPGAQAVHGSLAPTFVGWVFSPVIGPGLRLLRPPWQNPGGTVLDRHPGNGPPGAPAGRRARGRCGLCKEVM